MLSVQYTLTQPRTKSEEFIRQILGSKYFDDYLQKNIFALQKAPKVSVQEIVNAKISELMNLGKFFKYGEQLKNNNYIIELLEDRVWLKIVKKRLDGINYKANKEQEIVDVLEFKIIRIDDYIDLELISPQNYLDETGFTKEVSSNFGDAPPVNFIWTPSVVVDKEILNNLSPWISGKIINRTITRDKLRTMNGQNCDLYSDVTAATIIPYGNGTRAKIMTVDKDWDRIIWWDKDISGLDFGPITLQAPENPGQYYSLNMPSDIVVGTSYVIYNGFNHNGNVGTDTYYPLIITDRNNNRIVSVNYCVKIRYYSNYTFTENVILDNTFSVVRGNISQPFSLALHSGQSTNSGNDDVLWYTEGINIANKPLVAISGSNGSELQRINNVIYNGQSYSINAGRLSIYRSPDGQKNVMAFIDETRNCLFFLKLNTDGVFSTNPPSAFAVQDFNYQKLKSVVLSSTQNGIDGTTVWAVSDGGNGGCEGGSNCGYIHTLKLLYVGNNPVYADYLSSYWMGLNSEKSFVNLRNLQIQNGYIDIFTMEDWNHSYGIRRFKPGVGVISDNAGNYCTESNAMTIGVRLSTPCKMKVIAEYHASGEPWVYKPYLMNGYDLPNGITNMPSGNTSFNISVSYSSMAPEAEVRITLVFVPQDEDPNTSNNRIIKQYTRTVAACNWGGGGCPYVYVFDGDSLRQDNNILHKSEFTEFTGQDIIDKYKLNVYPKLNTMDHTYTLELREMNYDVSYFDQIQLKAIDHPIGTDITVTENKDIVLFFPHIVADPSAGFLNDSNITCQLFYDSTCVDLLGDSSDGLTVDFDEKDRSSYKTFQRIRTTLKRVLNIMSKSSKKINNIGNDYPVVEEIQDSMAVILDPRRSRIGIPTPVKDWAGQIVAYDLDNDYNTGTKLFSMRENRSVVAIPVGYNVIIDSIYTDWYRDFELSYFVTTPIYYGGYIENDLPLYYAIHSEGGDITASLVDSDNDYAVMDNKGTIMLKFEQSSNVPAGYVRDYILITNGRYEVIGDNLMSLVINKNLPKVFKLHQNFPNPFNPKATIKFDLPKDVQVLLKVYDILGREVAILLNENKKAGFHQVEFNGQNFASGVYFYRIEAGSFVQSKKMVLVK